MNELEPAQFDEWRAFYELEPWGDDRADLRIARLICAMELLYRGSDAFWQLADFCPYTEFADAVEDDDDEIDALFARSPSIEVQAERLRVAAWQFNAANGGG